MVPFFYNLLCLVISLFSMSQSLFAFWYHFFSTSSFTWQTASTYRVTFFNGSGFSSLWAISYLAELWRCLMIYFLFFSFFRSDFNSLSSSSSSSGSPPPLNSYTKSFKRSSNSFCSFKESGVLVSSISLSFTAKSYSS